MFDLLFGTLVFLQYAPEILHTSFARLIGPLDSNKVGNVILDTGATELRGRNNSNFPEFHAAHNQGTML